jgi:cell division protein FtsZ
LELGADLAVDEGGNEEETGSTSENVEPAEHSAESPAEDDLLELGAAEVAAVEDEAPAYQPTDVTPAPEKPAPRISTGGTLFERMSNLSRGLSRSDEDQGGDDKDGGAAGGLNIPRFLDRQSNN